MKLAEGVRSKRIQLFEATRQNVNNPIQNSYEPRQNAEEANKILYNHQSRPPERLDEDEYINNGHKTRPPELNSDALNYSKEKANIQPNTINDNIIDPISFLSHNLGNKPVMSYLWLRVLF